MSTTRPWKAPDAMTAKVDFPVPRIPMRTIEAFGSKIRGPSLGPKEGVGVVRGVDLLLGVCVSRTGSAYHRILYIAFAEKIVTYICLPLLSSASECVH